MVQMILTLVAQESLNHKILVVSSRNAPMDSITTRLTEEARKHTLTEESIIVPGYATLTEKDIIYAYPRQGFVEEDEEMDKVEEKEFLEMLDSSRRIW